MTDAQASECGLARSKVQSPGVLCGDLTAGTFAMLASSLVEL
jgi:hypothetical protein